jgi:ABC-type siderophore export system fused ATPase/permease subunit
VLLLPELLPGLLSPAWGEVPVDDEPVDDEPVDDEIEEITVVAVARTFVIDDVSDVG